MPGKGSDVDDRGTKSPPVPKRPSRPATGVSFLVMIGLACVATVLVILWTVHTSQENRGHVAPASFRM